MEGIGALFAAAGDKLPWVMLALENAALFRAWVSGVLLHRREYAALEARCSQLEADLKQERSEKEELYRMAMQSTQLASSLAEVQMRRTP